jgi:hypothetical protein
LPDVLKANSGDGGNGSAYNKVDENNGTSLANQQAPTETQSPIVLDNNNLDQEKIYRMTRWTKTVMEN